MHPQHPSEPPPRTAGWALIAIAFLCSVPNIVMSAMICSLSERPGVFSIVPCDLSSPWIYIHGFTYPLLAIGIYILVADGRADDDETP